MSRPPRRVRVEARAKLNLALAVGPRRRDGFHDLATVFQSVTLADTLFAAWRPRGFTLLVHHEGAAGATAQAVGEVPPGPDNLVLEAARAFARESGIEGGADFVLVKRIPTQAGLGGGSADAAAALAAMATLHGVRMDPGRRLRLAAELGSDVPFAVAGGTAVGLGRGERLRRIRLARPFRAVIAVPRWRVSTASAFARIDRGKYHLTRWRTNLRVAQDIGRKAVSAEDVLRIGNDFEQALGLHRARFERLRERMLAAGLRPVSLSGSGSAVFGLINRGTRAREVLERLRGEEALYVVRSAGAALSVSKQP